MNSRKNKNKPSSKFQKIVASLRKYQLSYIALGLLGAYGLFCTLQFYNLGNNTTHCAEFIIFLVAIPIALLYKKIRQYHYRVSSIIFSLILSIITNIGAQLDFNSEIIWRFDTILAVVLFTAFLFPITNFLFYKIINSQFYRRSVPLNRKTKFSIFLILLLVNLAVWLAFFPGIYGYDSPGQVVQFLRESVSTHFSPSFSFILYSFVSMGGNLFGSYEAGYAIYILLQVLFLTYVYTKIVTYVASRFDGRLSIVSGVLFFVINLPIQILSISSCQDAIFGGFFALIFIELLKIYEDPRSYFSCKTNYIKLPLFIIALCITRNNGLYAIFFTFIVALILMRGYRKSILVIFAAPILVCQLYTNLILPAFEVTISSDDSIKEMSSIPSQQLARVYVNDPQLLTENQIETLNYYYSDKLKDFDYYKVDTSIADNRKVHLNVDAIKNHPLGYAQLYLEVGLSAPGDYIEAAALTNLGLWYPSKQYHDIRMYHPLVEYKSSVPDNSPKDSIFIQNTPILSGYHDLLVRIFSQEHNSWQKVPVIRTLYTPGFYFIVSLFVLFIVFIRKNYRALLPLSLVCGLYITLMLSPVALFRYVFPVIILTPVLISIAFKSKRKVK